MEIHPAIYIILLFIIIVGPIMANVSYYGWKNAMLSRIFILVSAAALITAMALYLLG